MRSVEQPMPTVTATSSDMFLVEPYVSKYYGTGACQPVDEPLDTVTTKDRFGLVEPYLIPVGDNRYLGIRFRMLQPHELAAAQGFARNLQVPRKQIDTSEADRKCRTALHGEGAVPRTAPAIFGTRIAKRRSTGNEA